MSLEALRRVGAELCLEQAGLTARTEYVRRTEVLNIFGAVSRLAAVDTLAITNEDFDQFWTAYPRRIGKRAALHAYTIARRTVDQQTLLEAVERYVRCKPEWQQYCHPRTWLSQGRWDDQYDEPVRHDMSWADECAELHGGQCSGRYAHGLKMQIADAMNVNKRPRL